MTRKSGSLRKKANIRIILTIHFTRCSNHFIHISALLISTQERNASSLHTTRMSVKTLIAMTFAGMSSMSVKTLIAMEFAHHQNNCQTLIAMEFAHHLNASHNTDCHGVCASPECQSKTLIAMEFVHHQNVSQTLIAMEFVHHKNDSHNTDCRGVCASQE